MSFRWSCFAENQRSPAFAARLRCNTIGGGYQNLAPDAGGTSGGPKLGGTTGIVLFNHSFHWQLPWNKYAASHPEYFGMIDGVRAKTRKQAQPCLTNPDVVRIITASVLEQLEKNPGQESVSVSQHDWGHKCQCPTCEAIDRPQESGMGSLLTLVNAVAKQHPAVKVGTLAYYHTQKPPKTIKPRPNVIIQLTSHDCSVTDPIRDSDYEPTVQFRRDLEAWSKICGHINLWYYNTNFGTFQLPMPNLRVFEPNLRFFTANNIKGIFMQGAHNGLGAELSDLRNYVTSRLLWDPTQSGQDLIDEFLDLHYRCAAPPIRGFINRLHDNAEALGIQEAWWGHATDCGIDAAMVRAGLDAYEQAMQLADDDVVRARVEKASISVHMAALAEALPFVWYTPDTRPNSGPGLPLPPDVAARTRPHFRRYFALCKKHGVDRWNEQQTIDHMSGFFKAGFGLEPDQPW